MADAAGACNLLADIGTDHAYIPVYMVQNGLAENAIASDIVDGPVKIARKNVSDRKLSEKRVYPALDITKSGTRREDLLLDKEEQEAVYIMRKAINGMRTDEAVESILNMFVRTKNNKEYVQTVKKKKIL